MRLHKFFFLGFLPVTLLSGCLLFNGEEYIEGNVHLLPIIENQLTPVIVGSYSVGDGIGDFYSNLHPASIENTIFAADRKGTVCAFNIDNGKKVWNMNLAKKNGLFSHNSALLAGGVTVANGHVYIGSEKAQVYALSTKDGSVVWQTKVAGEALSQPVVSNGMVLIHTGNGQLQALNEINGAIKWATNLGIPFFSIRGVSTPAIAHDAVIIGSDNGYVSSLLIQNGQMIWQKRISQTIGTTEIARLSDIDATPVIIDDVVYAVAYNGNLTALNLRNGQMIWERKLSSVNDFIVHDNRIYLVDHNDQLLALSVKNGATLWTQSNLLYRLLTAPVLYNNILVVGDSKGYIHWVNPDTGYFIARQRIDSSGFLTKPVVTDDKLLIQSKRGVIYAIRL